MPHVPREGRGAGKGSMMGEPAVSSSPPPCHLLELLLSETDLHSTTDKHPESKQGGKAAGPGHPGSGPGCPVLPSPRLPGQEGCEGCARPWHRSRPGTAPREAATARGGSEVCRAQPGPLGWAWEGNQRPRRAASLPDSLSWAGERPGLPAAGLPWRAGVDPVGCHAGGTAGTRDAAAMAALLAGCRTRAGCAQQGCAKLVGRTWSRIHPGHTQEVH